MNRRRCKGMLFLSSFLLITLFYASCFNSKEKELGTRENPVKLYFTPSVDSEVVTNNSQEFIKFLEKETGLFFESGIPTSYIAVVEAFGSKRADIGVMNSFGYLLANEKYQAEAKLISMRYGEKFYRGAIFAHVDSKIENLSDLNGKRFAFTDSASTSGYLFPLKMLKENNVHLGKTVFGLKHDNVVTMIYQRQVEAGAAFYSPPTPDGEIRDARSRVKTQFPDVEQKIKVVAITEEIPNDPFVFRKDLPEEISSKFINALQKFLLTEQGKKVFYNIYSIEGVMPANDQDYNNLRAALKTVNADIHEFIK